MEKMKRKVYESELARLHGELVKVQRWVVHAGLKVCVVFEGRDAADDREVTHDRSDAAAAVHDDLREAHEVT